ncbi:MAG: alpha/beta hydrolase, partial [Polyangiaceae bacterium]|nr:alpha/beta hydrolase [Polyangiaceae bacterium]
MRRWARSDGMEAGYVESPFGPLFACYHPPQGPIRRDAAILFCDPFGSDRMNLHGAYRTFALHLAEQGFACLRLDYPGTCDSAGYPRDPGHFRSWLPSLDVAAEFLLRKSGAAELGAFGALLGGTIATVFAASRPDVTALGLWGPFPSGRAFLREIAAFRALTPANPNGVRPEGFAAGDQEAIGFLITAETAQELEALDPLSLDGPIARSVAIFPRNRASKVDRFAERMRRSGATVELYDDPIFDMNLLVNGKAEIPRALIASVGSFFTRAFPPVEQSGASRDLPRLRAEVELSSREGTVVREAATAFGRTGELFGIV